MSRGLGFVVLLSLTTATLALVRAVEEEGTARQAPPSASAQKDALALIKGVYKDEFAAARKPAKKAELAKRLLADGLATKNDPAGKYVLLTQAQNLASEIGDAATVFGAIDELEVAFTVNGPECRIGALQILAKLTLEVDQAQLALDNAKSVTANCIKISSLANAESAVSSGILIAKKGKLPKLAKELSTQLKYVQFLGTEFEKVSKALATLKEKPDDPTASQLVGKYQCLHLDDWQRGLVRLAKAKDDALRTIAAAELAQPQTAAEKVALGDKWWAAADAESEMNQLRMRNRAALWYQQTINEITGLDKAKIEKRLSQIEGLAAPVDSRLPARAAPRANAGKNRGLNVTVKKQTEFTGFEAPGSNLANAISADGRFVAASDENKIRLVDVATGKQTAVYDTPDVNVRSLQFSHDGKSLAAGYADKRIRIWDVAGARIKSSVDGMRLNAKRIAYSLDDSLLATVDDGENGHLWTSSGRQIREFGKVNAVMFLPRKRDKDRVALASNHKVDIFNTASEEYEGRIPTTSFGSFIDIALDGKTIVVGTNLSPEIIDVSQAAVITKLDTVTHCLRGALSPDGSIFAAAEGDLLRLWNTRTGQELNNIDLRPQYANWVAFSSNGRNLIACGRKAVVIWEYVVE